MKKRAIELRKQGLSYNEILCHVPVAKSTLSLWLRDVGLSKKQQQVLSRRKLQAMRRGAKQRKLIRLRRTAQIQRVARKEIPTLTKRDVWMLGIGFYWAEGTKQKTHSPGQRMSFSNSDPAMIRLFLRWLREVLSVPSHQLVLSIYIHENNKSRIADVKKYWSQSVGLSVETFAKVYFKRHNLYTVRKKVEKDYYGLVRIDVRASTDLNRRVTGWIQGVTGEKNWGVV